jgi:hypothetical protein
MRTKTLLIATAAALAAGIISSQAQVYSQNIVGYVNIPAKIGYNIVANPLDNGADNLTNVINNSNGQWNYTYAYIYTGTGYSTYTIDNGVATGVADPSDSFAVTAPIIKPGQAFFFQNNTGTSNTLTCVGTVHVDAPSPTNGVVGVSTNTLGLTGSSQLSFVGSVIPVGGGLASVDQFPATNGTLNYAYVNVPNINAAGNLTGFTQYTVDNGFASGFADPSDSFQVAEPILQVGSGFFFQDNLGHSAPWVQSF